MAWAVWGCGVVAWLAKSVSQSGGRRASDEVSQGLRRWMVSELYDLPVSPGQ